MSSLSATKPANSMAELMKKAQASFYVPKKGEIVKGIVTKLTSAEILIDINAKTEAVVLEKDRKILRNILSSLEIGDEVTVSILNPESDMGNSVVSLRRFLDDIMWQKLADFQKKKEAVEVTVTEITKGGFLVESSAGVSGFLPNSQAVVSSQDAVGKKVTVFVWELNRPMRKVIFSQKPVLSKDDFEKATKNLEVGKKIKATVSNVTPFGVFVSLPSALESLPTIDGLIHISEISWEKVENLEEGFATGNQIEVVIIGKDSESKRVDLSLKRLETDPFEEASKAYKEDQKITGVVARVSMSGVVIDIAQGVEGMIRKEKIPPGVVYKEGESISATVSQVDVKRRKIILIPVLLKKTIGYR